MVGRAKIHSALDQEFALFCIEKRRFEQLYEVDGGAEEQFYMLKQVSHHQERCEHWIERFWSNLLTDTDSGSGASNEVIATIQKYEQKCDELLISFCTSSPNLLKSFELMENSC
jgi:hypothetical protein